jgi:hypothetical protein
MSFTLSYAANVGAVMNTFSSARSFFCARPFGITTIIGEAFPSAIKRIGSKMGNGLPARWSFGSDPSR